MDDDGDEERGLSEVKGRATPGRRVRETTARPNFAVRFIRAIGDYLGGVRDELRKVTWPTREELTRLTIIVLIVTIASSIVLGLISFMFTELFILGFDNEIVFALMFAVMIGGYVAYTRMNSRGRNVSRY
jgi:preprotein translocase subunit SecE